MTKKPSKRKKAVKTFDPRLINKGRSYTAKEIAEIFGIDESSVHRWRREEGLISIDDKTPALFHWETTKQFLEHKKQSRKMKTGNAGDLPCLKCFLKRRAYQDKIAVKKVNDKIWNIQGICSCCGSKMNMRTQANEFLLTITWGYEIIETLPKFSIKGNHNTSVTTTAKRHPKTDRFEFRGKLNFCPDNERIKHKYYDRVIYRFGKDAKTLRKIISALQVFEEFNNFQDFKLFDFETSKSFQKHLLQKYSHSMQMAHRTMNYVQEFFFWLREQSGYKKLDYDDIKSLQLSRKDKEKARTSKPRDYLSAEKWQELIINIKPENEKELRGQAMFACLLLTGMRVDALISLRISDVNFEHNYIFQDSNHVNTKFSKSNKTNLWNFTPEIKQILVDWVDLLQKIHGFKRDNPLFPQIKTITNEQLQFERSGFLPEFLKKTDVVRKELTEQLKKSGLEHYTPHTIRNSLTALFMGFDLTPEQMKAVSQNLSHKNLETTLTSYGAVNELRQDKIIEGLDVEKLLEQQKIQQDPKYQYIMSKMTDEETVDTVFDAIIKASKKGNEQ